MAFRTATVRKDHLQSRSSAFRGIYLFTAKILGVDAKGGRPISPTAHIALTERHGPVTPVTLKTGILVGPTGVRL